VTTVDRAATGGSGRFTADDPARAPTRSVTLGLVGEARTVSCVIREDEAWQFR
jgi:hypothetical protein